MCSSIATLEAKQPSSHCSCTHLARGFASILPSEAAVLVEELGIRLRMFVFPMLADDAVHLARFEVVISGQAKFANRTLPAIDSSLLDRRQRRQRVFEADFQLFLLIGMPSIDMSSLLVNPSFAHPSGKVTQRACPLSTLSASGRSTGCVLSFTGCTWRARTPTRSSSRRGRRILALL